MNVQGAGCTGGSRTDHYTGLEARFIGEVSRAATGLSRERANELVLQLVARYEGTLEEPRYGYPFPEVYDEVTVRPKENWLNVYQQVKDELARFGISFSS